MGSFDLSIAQKMAIVVAVPVASFLLYFLLKKSNEEEEDNRRCVTSRQTIVEVKVPRSIAGAIIGPRGARIKEVQEGTGARIQFKDDQSSVEEERTVVIRGKPDAAQRAEMIIRRMIAEIPPIISETISVPDKAVGRIIGRGGETIRSLCRTSKAKIQVPPEKRANGVQVVQLQGTPSAIETAKALIEEKVHEEEALRARIAVNASNRQERGPRKKLDAPDTEPQVASAPPHGTKETGDEGGKGDYASREAEEENALSSQQSSAEAMPARAEWSNHRDYLEVYVSAVEHPGHFWVQVISSKATQLDDLFQEMTRYYSNLKDGQATIIGEIQKGDLLAAPFSYDDMWYRVRVLGFEGDKVDVYYVDFGDSEYLDKSQLRALRGDFLSLPFQAIEVSLANVKPTGSEWSEEAIVLFEGLSHTAKWKVLMARTVSYVQTEDGESRPCLELIDTNCEKDINIAKELISKGYAVYVQEKVDTLVTTSLGTASNSAVQIDDSSDKSKINFATDERKGSLESERLKTHLSTSCDDQHTSGSSDHFIQSHKCVLNDELPSDVSPGFSDTKDDIISGCVKITDNAPLSQSKESFDDTSPHLHVEPFDLRLLQATFLEDEFTSDSDIFYDAQEEQNKGFSECVTSAYSNSITSYDVHSSPLSKTPDRILDTDYEQAYQMESADRFDGSTVELTPDKEADSACKMNLPIEENSQKAELREQMVVRPKTLPLECDNYEDVSSKQPLITSESAHVYSSKSLSKEVSIKDEINAALLLEDTESTPKAVQETSCSSGVDGTDFSFVGEQDAKYSNESSECFREILTKPLFLSPDDKPELICRDQSPECDDFIEVRDQNDVIHAPPNVPREVLQTKQKALCLNIGEGDGFNGEEKQKDLLIDECSQVVSEGHSMCNKSKGVASNTGGSSVTEVSEGKFPEHLSAVESCTLSEAGMGPLQSHANVNIEKPEPNDHVDTTENRDERFVSPTKVEESEELHEKELIVKKVIDSQSNFASFPSNENKTFRPAKESFGIPELEAVGRHELRRDSTSNEIQEELSTENSKEEVNRPYVDVDLHTVEEEETQTKDGIERAHSPEAQYSDSPTLLYPEVMRTEQSANTLHGNIIDQKQNVKEPIDEILNQTKDTMKHAESDEIKLSENVNKPFDAMRSNISSVGPSTDQVIHFKEICLKSEGCDQKNLATSEASILENQVTSAAEFDLESCKVNTDNVSSTKPSKNNLCTTVDLADSVKFMEIAGKFQPEKEKNREQDRTKTNIVSVAGSDETSMVKDDVDRSDEYSHTLLTSGVNSVSFVEDLPCTTCSSITLPLTSCAEEVSKSVSNEGESNKSVGTEGESDTSVGNEDELDSHGVTSEVLTDSESSQETDFSGKNLFSNKQVTLSSELVPNDDPGEFHTTLEGLAGHVCLPSTAEKENGEIMQILQLPVCEEGLGKTSYGACVVETSADTSCTASKSHAVRPTTCTKVVCKRENIISPSLEIEPEKLYSHSESPVLTQDSTPDTAATCKLPTPDSTPGTATTCKLPTPDSTPDTAATCKLPTPDSTPDTAATCKLPTPDSTPDTAATCKLPTPDSTPDTAATCKLPTPDSTPDTAATCKLPTLDSTPDTAATCKLPTPDSTPDTAATCELPTPDSTPDTAATCKLPTPDSTPDTAATCKLPTLDSTPDTAATCELPTLDSTPNTAATCKLPTPDSTPDTAATCKLPTPDSTPDTAATCKLPTPDSTPDTVATCKLPTPDSTPDTAATCKLPTPDSTPDTAATCKLPTPDSTPDTAATCKLPTPDSTPDTAATCKLPTPDSTPDTVATCKLPTPDSTPDTAATCKLPTPDSTPDTAATCKLPTPDSTPDTAATCKLPTPDSTPDTAATCELPTPDSTPDPAATCELQTEDDKMEKQDHISIFTRPTVVTSQIKSQPDDVQTPSEIVPVTVQSFPDETSLETLKENEEFSLQTESDDTVLCEICGIPVDGDEETYLYNSPAPFAKGTEIETTMDDVKTVDRANCQNQLTGSPQMKQDEPVSGCEDNCIQRHKDLFEADPTPTKRDDISEVSTSKTSETVSLEHYERNVDDVDSINRSERQEVPKMCLTAISKEPMHENEELQENEAHFNMKTEPVGDQLGVGDQMILSDNEDASEDSVSENTVLSVSFGSELSCAKIFDESDFSEDRKDESKKYSKIENILSSGVRFNESAAHFPPIATGLNTDVKVRESDVPAEETLITNISYSVEDWETCCVEHQESRLESQSSQFPSPEEIELIKTNVVQSTNPSRPGCHITSENIQPNSPGSLSTQLSDLSSLPGGSKCTLEKRVTEGNIKQTQIECDSTLNSEDNMEGSNLKELQNEMCESEGSIEPEVESEAHSRNGNRYDDAAPTDVQHVVTTDTNVCKEQKIINKKENSLIEDDPMQDRNSSSPTGFVISSSDYSVENAAHDNGANHHLKESDCITENVNNDETESVDSGLPTKDRSVIDVSKHDAVKEWLRVQASPAMPDVTSSVCSEGSSSSESKELLNACKGEESIDFDVPCSMETSSEDIEDTGALAGSESLIVNRTSKRDDIFIASQINDNPTGKVKSGFVSDTFYLDTTVADQGSRNAELVSSHCDKKAFDKALNLCKGTLTDAYIKTQPSYANESTRRENAHRLVGHLAPQYALSYRKSHSTGDLESDRERDFSPSGTWSEDEYTSIKRRFEYSQSNDLSDDIDDWSSIEDSLEEPPNQCGAFRHRSPSPGCKSTVDGQKRQRSTGQSRHCSLYDEFQDMLEEVYGHSSLFSTESTTSTSYASALEELPSQENVKIMADSLEDLTTEDIDMRYKHVLYPYSSRSSISEDSLNDVDDIFLLAGGGEDVCDTGSSFTDDSIEDSDRLELVPRVIFGTQLDETLFETNLTPTVESPLQLTALTPTALSPKTLADPPSVEQQEGEMKKDRSPYEIAPSHPDNVDASRTNSDNN